MKNIKHEQQRVKVVRTIRAAQSRISDCLWPSMMRIGMRVQARHKDRSMAMLESLHRSQ